jgi:uncharacterized repeat protein (TIGR01451 family)
MKRTPLLAVAALAFAAACSDNNPTQLVETPVDLGPLLGASQPENPISGGGKCMGGDSRDGGRVGGMKNDGDLNCTANDVNLAEATITRYSFDGTNFIDWDGTSVSCDEFSDIWVETTANLASNATERYDVGIWLPDLQNNPNQNPANAVTGTCRHWNLINPQGTPPVRSDPPSASNLDSDQCGDVHSSATPANPVKQVLGVLKLKCDDVDPNHPGKLAVGACLGWNNNRSGSACPLKGTNAVNFRWGTTPETKSKCNCSPMLFPITVVQKGKIELKKALSPSSDAGKFNLSIRKNNSSGDVVASATNVGDGGTTGAGGTELLTGAYHLSETEGTGTTLANYTASGPTCVNRTGGGSVTVTNGVVQLQSGMDVVCTITNTRKPPQLSINKTPDSGSVSQGGTATFSITVSNAASAGPAYNTVLTDTLPNSGLTWSIGTPVPQGCSISSITLNSVSRQLLTCNIGTLNAGGSFTVSVSATIPSNFLQPSPGRTGDALNAGDGNLAVDGSEIDWASASLGINCLTETGCKLDLASGAGDNSFGQGTDENTTVPTVVSGSIPPNKSDLTRFYIADERVGNFDYLYLGWRRVQDPSGTTNMDFELNQSTQLSSNGVTPVRTAGDLLIAYDLAQGGTTPVLSFRRWTTTGPCGWPSGKPPCWGPATTLSPAANDVAGSVNTISVPDPFAPSPTMLSPYTFGEARINLQQSGIFESNVCRQFGRAYLKSRSSDSPSSALKDFIAPVAIDVSSCVPTDLNNRAWADADEQDPISDTGKITVTVNGAALLTAPAGVQLAQRSADVLLWRGAVAAAYTPGSRPVAELSVLGRPRPAAGSRLTAGGHALSPWPQRIAAASPLPATGRWLGGPGWRSQRLE